MHSNKYYKYSAEEVRFVEVYKNETEKYLKNYPLFLFGFVSCLILVISLSFIFPTPREHSLIKKNEELQIAFDALNKEVSNIEIKLQTLTTKDDSLYRMILGAEPIPETMRKAGKGGAPIKKLDISPELGAIPNAINDRIAQLSPKINVLDYSLDETMKLAEKNTERLLHIPAIMPVYNKDLQRTGAGFGMRMHPVLGIRRMHEGLDFYATTGSNVFATADGKVKSTHYSTTFGNIVIVDHGNGVETYYAHLTKFNVKKGQKIKRGDVLGFVGATGLVSGPHLHYEVHLNGKEVDPIRYIFADLSPEQNQEVIKLSKRDVYSMD